VDRLTLNSSLQLGCTVEKLSNAGFEPESDDTHYRSPTHSAKASGRFWLKQFRQYQGAGVLTGFELLFRHLAQW